MYIPIGHPNPKSSLHNGDLILAGDIGGTKSDLAILEVMDEKLRLLKEKQYRSQDYPSFEKLIEEFYDHETFKVSSVSLGVAGPVYKGKVKTTNLPWELDSLRIGRRLGVDHTYLLNDLEANAYGIAMLEESDIHTIYTGTEAPEGNVAVIAPGTGLGEAGMYWDGNYLHPFATEGGHVSFAPRESKDLALLQFLHKKFDHVSWERLLSGPGIYNIYCFLEEDMNRNISDDLKNEIHQSLHPSLVITKAALKGVCEVCTEVLHLFIKYLGEEAAHLCLKIKATGGLFISGGIVPDILIDRFDEIFLESFLNVGRMRSLLENIPVKLVMNERTALLGAAYYGVGF